MAQLPAISGAEAVRAFKRLVGGKIVSAAAMSFLSKRAIMLPCRFLNTANWHPERSALSSVHPVSVSKNLSLSYS